MTAPYPLGSSIPIQPWMFERIQTRLGHQREGMRKAGQYDQYLVERFGAWRVFPVKVGRWVRESYSSYLTDDLLSLALAPVLLPLRAGRWKPDDHIVQVLDPASGMPIAEQSLFALKVEGENELARWRQTRQLAFLGDPRVGGLIAPVPADSVHHVHRTSRRGHFFGDSVAEYEQKAAQLVNLPYRDFSERNDGPWIVDQPEKPKGNTNGWKPSPWYRPA